MNTKSQLGRKQHEAKAPETVQPLDVTVGPPALQPLRQDRIRIRAGLKTA